MPTLKFSLSFLLTEWEELVDAWQLQTWESYRDIKRLGRKTRLHESQRATLWAVLDAVRGRLRAEGFVTHAEIFTRLAGQLESRKHPPFEFIVVDEAQDLSVSQLQIPGRARRKTTQQPIFCRRSRATHFSAAFLLEVAGCGYSWPRAHLTHQLPHFAPDQNADRPIARTGGCGC